MVFLETKTMEDQIFIFGHLSFGKLNHILTGGQCPPYNI